MAVSCGNRTLLLTKQGFFPETSNAEYYQKMVFGICSLIIGIYFPFLNSLGFMPFILLKKRAKVVTSEK